MLHTRAAQLLDHFEVRTAEKRLPLSSLLTSGLKLHIDEVIEGSGLPTASVSEILLDLELQGYLRQLPGKRYLAET